MSTAAIARFAEDLIRSGLWEATATGQNQGAADELKEGVSAVLRGWTMIRRRRANERLSAAYSLPHTIWPSMQNSRAYPLGMNCR